MSQSHHRAFLVAIVNTNFSIGMNSAPCQELQVDGLVLDILNL